MDGFNIATERIGAAAGGVAEIGAELNQEIAAMDGLLAELSSGWRSSTAAPRFAQAMHGYLDQARALSSALLGHGEGLAASSRAFDAAEEAIAAATPAGVA